MDLMKKTEMFTQTWLETIEWAQLNKLRNVLIAYSIHVNPCVGYCQAMNFIAALLLVIFDGNESAALM